MTRIKHAWRTSIFFGIASALAIILTFIKRPEDIHYAGSMFAYNLTFFFPLFILSLALGIVSFIYFIKYLKYFIRCIKISKIKNKTDEIFKIGLPILTMLPIGLHLIFVFVGILSIITYVPKYHELKFNTTPRIIKFENSNLTLYLHGALFGKFYGGRLVYLSDKPFSESNPDTSRILKYKGGDNLLLFYKTKNNTLTLFIPKGLMNRPLSFNKNIEIQQKEFTYEEVDSLYELSYKGKIISFVWGMY